MNGQPFCPDSRLWYLSVISLHPDQIRLHLEPVRIAVPCPDCGFLSSRVHSRYQRKPWDLPWSLWPVQLFVHSRKFFCDNQACSGRIFTERFPGVLESYARKTTRLDNILLELAHASSAENAARVGKRMGYEVSPDALLNLQRKEHFDFPNTTVLGVDEFSMRRGQTYSTLLVDLERHQPIDVLEGKEAAPLAKWLHGHPGISVLARDRAEAYAQAGRTAAPEAIQVADRFHLVKNVNDALKELLRSHRWEIPENEFGLANELAQARSSLEPKAQSEQNQPSPVKVALWEEVQERNKQGQSIRAISRELDIHRKTVRIYMEARSPPAYRFGSPRPTKLKPHLKYIMQRWNEGCHNARTLHIELNKRGYNGGYTQIKDLVRPWRSRKPGKLPLRSRVSSRVSLNQWLFLRPNDRLDPIEKQELELVLEANPKLALGYHLKEEFQRIVAQHDVEALDGWITKATLSELKPFQSLAKGMTHDLEAIRNGLTLPWSTAQCEGQICRAKLIKRQGYGRAKLDLLRQRILHRRAVA